MKRITLVIFVISMLCQTGFSQDSTYRAPDSVRLVEAPSTNITPLRNTSKDFVSPYKTSFVKDGITILAAAGLTEVGYILINHKNNLTPAELSTKSINDLPFFDRWVAGNYSDKANKDSYILFDASYAYPFLIALLNKNEHKKFGQVSVMFVETIAITGAMYTMAAGLVYRSRPFVYSTTAPMDLRLGKGGQRSFYGGHVAATAAASFFTASVYKAFNPGSKLQPYIWGVAAALPAVMSYERMRAGYHFLSDCAVAYIIGASTGILIPKFHRNKHLQNLTLLPTIGKDYQGINIAYHIK